jgi:hypothetical protein
MAEMQKTSSVNAGEMAQRFLQFIIMQSQQVLFVLGIPTPDGESIPANLEGAKILIDQLEMIQEKTRGNLSPQETALLEDALTRVRFAYVQVSGGAPASSAHNPAAARDPIASEPIDPKTTPNETKSKPGDEPDGKKKFTKTYG